MVRPLAIAVALLLLAGPAYASDKKEGEAAPPPDVDLVPVAVPIVIDGHVRNYVFVTVRITASATGDPNLIRQQEPLLRDAVVRAAFKTPMTRADNYNLVDAPRLVSAITPAFQTIIGKGKAKSITIAKQQPKNVLRMPKRPG